MICVSFVYRVICILRFVVVGRIFGISRKSDLIPRKFISKNFFF